MSAVCVILIFALVSKKVSDVMVAPSCCVNYSSRSSLVEVWEFKKATTKKSEPQCAHGGLAKTVMNLKELLNAKC